MTSNSIKDDFWAALPEDASDPFIFHALIDWRKLPELVEKLIKDNAALHSRAVREEDTDKEWWRASSGAMNDIDETAGDNQYIFFSPCRPFWNSTLWTSIPYHEFPVFAFRLSTLRSLGHVQFRPHDLQAAYLDVDQGVRAIYADISDDDQDFFDPPEVEIEELLDRIVRYGTTDDQSFIDAWCRDFLFKDFSRSRALIAKNGVNYGSLNYPELKFLKGTEYERTGTIDIAWRRAFSKNVFQEDPDVYPEIIVAPEDAGIPLQSADYWWNGEKWTRTFKTNPAKSSKLKLIDGKVYYRDCLIEAYQGVQLGYRTHDGRHAGKGRKSVGFMVHIDGYQKIVSTLKEAQVYIDNYLGDE